MHGPTSISSSSTAPGEFGGVWTAMRSVERTGSVANVISELSSNVECNFYGCIPCEGAYRVSSKGSTISKYREMAISASYLDSYCRNEHAKDAWMSHFGQSGNLQV